MFVIINQEKFKLNSNFTITSEELKYFSSINTISPYVEVLSLYSKMNSTTAFAYPVQLKISYDNSSEFIENQTDWVNEMFVTYDEPNFFQEPYQSFEVKIAAFVAWLCGFTGRNRLHSFPET